MKPSKKTGLPSRGILLLAVLIIALAAPQASAHGTHINGCGNLFGSNTYYHLTGDIVGGQNCIQIFADSSTFDCTDEVTGTPHTIDFAGVSQVLIGTGILVSGNDVTVENCIIRETSSAVPGGAGIRLSSGHVNAPQRVTLLNNTISMLSPPLSSPLIDFGKGGGIANGVSGVTMTVVNNTVTSAPTPPISSVASIPLNIFDCTSCDISGNFFGNSSLYAASSSVVSRSSVSIANNKFVSGLFMNSSFGTVFNNTIRGPIGNLDLSSLEIVGGIGGFKSLNVSNNVILGLSVAAIRVFGPFVPGQLNFFGNLVKSRVFGSSGSSFEASVNALVTNDVLDFCIGCGVLVSGNSSVRFTNVSMVFGNFPLAVSEFAGEVNNATVSWFLDAKVTNGGQPVSGATVTIANATSLTPMRSFSTYSNGSIPRQELVEFFHSTSSGSGYSRKYFSPYSLQAFSGVSNAFQQVTFNSSSSVVLPLGLTECGSVSSNIVLDGAAVSAGGCFNVQANNIIVDCRGYNVTYATAGISQPDLLNGAGAGFYSNGFSNVTVKNCIFIEGNSSSRNSSAIVFFNSPNSASINNTVIGRVDKASISYPAAPVDGLQLFVPLDGNARDASGSGLDGTIVGSPAFQASGCAKSGCVYFNPGAFPAQTITFPEDGRIESSQVSVSLWFKGSQGGGNAELFGTRISAGQGGYGLISFGSTGQVAFELYRGGDGATVYSNVTPLLDSKWHNAIATYDFRNILLYVDGALAGTYSFSSSLPATYAPGAVSLAAGFNGVVDQLRVYNRSLSPVEAQQLYQSDAGLMISVNLDGDLLDSSGNSRNGIPIGASPAFVSSCAVGGCARFNGVNNVLDFGSAVPHSQYISLSFWASLANQPAGTSGIFTGPDLGYYVFVYGNNGPKSVVFQVQNAVGTTVNCGSFSDEKMRHYALTYDGQAAKCYVDGVLTATQLNQAGGQIQYAQGSNVPNAYLSAYVSASQINYFNGSIDEFKLYGFPLSPQDVSQLYSEGKPGVSTGVHSHAIVVSNSPNALVKQNTVNVSGTDVHGVLLQPGSFNATVMQNIVATNASTSVGIAGDSLSLAFIDNNSISTRGDVSPAIYLYGVGAANLISHNTLSIYGQGSDGVLLKGVSPSRQLYAASNWSSSGMTFFNSTSVNDGIGCESTEAGLPCQQAVNVSLSGVGTWIVLDSGTGGKQFSRLRIQSRGLYSAVWDVQFSDDLSTWSTAYAGWNSGASVDSAIDLPATGVHRYWRLLKTNPAGAGDWIGEIQFYQTTPTAVSLAANSISVFGSNSRGIYLSASSGVSIDSTSIALYTNSTVGALILRSSKIVLNNSQVASTSPSLYNIGLLAGEATSIGVVGAKPVSSLSMDGNVFSIGAGLAASLVSVFNSFSNNQFLAVGSRPSVGLYLSSNNSFVGGKMSTPSSSALHIVISSFNSFEGVLFSNSIDFSEDSKQNSFYDPINASLQSFSLVAGDTSTFNFNLYWSVRAQVRDSSGALLSGAKVNITNSQGAGAYGLVTDANGLTPFVKTLVFSGLYSASTNFNPVNFNASVAGFQATSVSVLVSSPFVTQALSLNLSRVARPASVAGNFLVALPTQGSVAEFNSSGAQVWSFSGSPSVFASPREVVSLDNGSVLVTDSAANRVAEFSSSGEVTWQYGIAGVNGSGFNQLYYPSTAVRTAEGTTLIADTLNDRLIEVDSAGNVVWKISVTRPSFALKQGNRVLTGNIGSVLEFNYTSKAQVWSFAITAAHEPKAYFMADGNVLVVDKLSTVSEVSRVLPSSGTVIWSKPVAGVVDAFEMPDGRIAVVGDSISILGADRQTLTQVVPLATIPSSIKPGIGAFVQPVRLSARTGASYFVADTGSKRVVELDDKLANVLWVFSSDLDTPAGIDSADNGQRLFIADSGLRKVMGVWYPNATVFFQKSFPGTPVDVKWVSGDLILVTDSSSNLVQEINVATGAVTWSFGNGTLNSPRGAFPLSDGSVLVADSGNNRVLKVSRSGQFVDVRPSGQVFSQPSRAVQKPDGNIIVADTGKRRIVEFDSSGTVAREIFANLSAPSSVAVLPFDKLLISDQGRNFARIIGAGNSVLANYTQLSSPSDAVLASDPSFYYSVYSTLIQAAQANAFSRKLPQAFSFILARGSIGSVQPLAVDNSLWQPYASIGGLQASSCQPDDLSCCTTSWCNSQALSDFASIVKQKAVSVANSTAFRRGGGQPISSFGNIPFVYSTVAQVAQGVSFSNVSGFTFSCLRSNCMGPGVFILKATTFNASDSSNWSYSAEPLKLFSSHATEGGQALDTDLLGFVYANSSQILVSSQPNLLSGNQLAKQSISSSDCSWPRVSCTAVRGACCRFDQAGACTAFSYSFTPSSAAISPTGANCGNASVTVRCSPSSWCGETDSVTQCTPVIAPTAIYQIANGSVTRSSQDGLSFSCTPVSAPSLPSLSADSLASQLSQFVKPPVCVVGVAGACPPVAITAATNPGILNSVKISTQ